MGSNIVNSSIHLSTKSITHTINSNVYRYNIVNINLNCVTKLRRMSQLSSIICAVSLLLMVSTSVIYYVLLHHHPTIFYQQVNCTNDFIHTL
jgi:hypothetical protein